MCCDCVTGCGHEAQIWTTLERQRCGYTDDGDIGPIEHRWVCISNESIVASQRGNLAVAYVRDGALATRDRLDFRSVHVIPDYLEACPRKLDRHGQSGVAETDDRDPRRSCSEFAFQ